MEQVRQNIWDMFDGKSKAGSYYDIIMMVVIVASLIPLIFKRETAVLLWIDHITVTIFIIDYILRWITADFRLKKGRRSFGLYPVTPWAILDLVCILPSFRIIAGAFRILKVARLFRTLRILRSLKLLRNNKSIRIIIDVIMDQWRALLTVLVIAVGYVLIVALVMFNMEPDTFNNFFSSVYWATITLTTIGYGDIYPVTILGQTFTIISAFVGVAVIALPSGIIAGGFMDEIRKEKDEEVEELLEEEVAIQERQDTNPLTQIEKLSELHEKGVLTDEEYGSKKTELLGRI